MGMCVACACLFVCVASVSVLVLLCRCGVVVCSKKQKLYQALLKNGVDMVIPAARLEWLPVSDAVVGVAGTITSIIGIRDSWPTAK